jgi:uncharacterized protein (DUF488 family)
MTMRLYTIGFTKKSARQFFEILKSREIGLLIDVRLNNRSQLAGFTKGEDLPYFLKEICQAEYRHDLNFAPDKGILDAYKRNGAAWGWYEENYLNLLRSRDETFQICRKFAEAYSQYQNIALLCSEPSAEKCHRRLAAEEICKHNPDIALEHV